MSQCSAVHSVSERMAWGRGMGGGSVGSSSVVCNWQVCGDVGSAELGGAVRCGVVISAQAAYAVGETGDEAEGWAGLWTLCHADGEVEFCCMRVQGRSRLRWWLELLLDASPAATKCAVGKVRAGCIEAEKFVEYNL